MTSNRTMWVAILGVALLARLAAGAWWQARLGEERFFFGDSDGYWELGRAIARGEAYQYLSPEARVFRAPGYPVLLAALFGAMGADPPVLAARALGAVLGTVAVGVLGWWSTQLFDVRAGMFAGWIAAVYPGGVALSVFVLSEAPFCALMLAHLALWGVAWQATSQRAAAGWAVAGGAAAAGATLMRPSWLLFTPFALAIGLTFCEQRRRQLLLGVAMCAALVVGLLPWWVRNAFVTGRFVPTTLQVGASLYDGLHPRATGGSDMHFVPQQTARARAALAEQRGEDVFEYHLDRWMFRAAVDWAWANPTRAIQLVGIKFHRMWNVWPNEPAFRGWTVRLAMLLTYVPLLALGVVGVWRFTPWGWPYVLAWLPAAYLTLLHVVFVSSIRYREPAMLALTVLAAGVLSNARRADGAAIADSRLNASEDGAI